MKIRKTKRAKSVKKTKRSNRSKRGTHAHKLQNLKLSKKHLVEKVSEYREITPQQAKLALQRYMIDFKNGVTIHGALENSRAIDIERSHKQIKAQYLYSKTKTNIFHFVVKSSGLHYKENSSEIATHYQVDVQLLGLQSLMFLDDVDEVLKSVKVKFNCTCPWHKYSFRYKWTILNSALGLQERRYPRIRNRYLEGLLCKHGVKTFEGMLKPSFKIIIKRYIENMRKGKDIRISKKDRARVAISNLGLNK